MEIIDIEKEFDRLSKNDNNIVGILNFKRLLLSDSSPQAINCHYELLRKRDNTKLYLYVRAAFMERKNIETFLLEKIKTEKDERLQADILHILGTKHSQYAAHYARDFVKHNNEHHREVASLVLGWLGAEEDILTLKNQLLNEKSPMLRISAANAHRQIAWREERLKDTVLKSLKSGYEKEKNEKVLSWIIVMISDVANEKFGLQEDKTNPDVVHGDIDSAKRMTEKFLKTL